MSIMALFKLFFANLRTTIIRKLFVNFVFLFVYFIHGYTQTPELKMKYFSRAEGLLSSYIKDVQQDFAGFIWIATHDGLYKYDGYNFTAYFSRQKDSSTLTNNNLSCLYSDSKGRLWVGTMLGLCMYNNDFDNFERLTGLTSFTNLIDQSVTEISEDKNGNILVCSGNCIFKYDEVNKKFTPVLSVKNAKISHFLVDKFNSVWIACSDKQGLKKFNLNSGKWEPVLPPGIDNKDLSNCTISHLSMGDGKLWMATLGEGIKMLDINSHKYTRYPFANKDEAMALNTYIDNKKNVWTVDYTGLKILDKKTGKFIGYYPELNNPQSIKGNVRGIFQDKQGNYWIFHEPGGVGLSLALKGFRYFNNAINNYWHTSSENIVSLYEDSRGNLWTGNASGGITVFEYQKRTTTNYQYNEPDKFSIGKGGIMCIFRDSKDIMWISSYSGGLQYFDDKNGKFISYNHNPDDSNSIADNDIRSIAEDSEGNLWMAVHGKGVDKFDRKQSKFVHYNNLLNNLSNDWAFQVLTDYKGNLWVATAWGLNFLKKGESKFSFYFSEQSDTSSLSNSFINTIYQDNNHILWIGTSTGLDRYNPENNNFTQYNNTFENNNISGILSDNDNNLWISNLSGLAMFDYKNKQIKNFSSIDGLITDEFNPRSCYKNKSNELIFGGAKGIVIFKPDELIYNTLPPFVFIDKIKILNKEIELADSDYRLQKQISRTQKITLKYSDNVITISYKALNFINPQSNQYAYMLEGFDKKWNYVQNNREATYTNLDPGVYTFKVIASNNDGVWNNKGTELKIKILPPWYATIAFRIIALLLIICSIIGFIKIRTSKLKKQQILLEKAVTEKTFELSEKNSLLNERKNLLEQQSEELKIQSENLNKANIELHEHNKTKDRLFSLIAHDLSSPFNTIIGFSDLLVSEFDSISEEKKSVFINAINLSSKKVNALLQSLLLWASSQGGRISINPEKIVLNKIIDETVELSSENLKIKQISIKVDCDENVYARADLMMVKTIIRNLINNAIKFTSLKGSIYCKVITDNNMVKVSICDTGIGIKQEKIDEILSSNIIMSEIGTDGEIGSGLGLTLCKDFIHKNKGELQITSEEGKGSTFTFTLPQLIE